MNYIAPPIKKCSIEPGTLEFEKAVSLMSENPILIKRSLIIVDDKYIQGFTDCRLKEYLDNWDGREYVITCPNLAMV